MGKLILGIGVVILLQISFSIYMAMDERTNTPVLTTRTGDYSIDTRRNAQPEGKTSAQDPPAKDATLSPEPTGINTGESFRLSAVRVAERRLGRRENVRVHTASTGRRPTGRLNGSVARVEPLVRREFFGGMMVETKYEVASNRLRNIPRNKTRREVFGRMIVEYKVAV